MTFTVNHSMLYQLVCTDFQPVVSNMFVSFVRWVNLKINRYKNMC